jgi:hypothetical protein
MIISIIVVSLVFIAAGIALDIFGVRAPFGIVEDQYIKAVPFALGVALMAGLNVAKVCLIERTVKKTVEIEKAGSGRTYIRLQYFARFGLTAVVLIVAALAPFIDIWGAVAGVMSFQIAAFSLKFMNLEETAPPSADGTPPSEGSIKREGD